MTADRRLPTLSLADGQHLEQLLQEFEQQWSPTRLAEWLPRLAESESSHRAPLLLGLVEIDLRCHWQIGEQLTVEDYLIRFPELGTPETVSVELVLVEYLARERAGLRPRPAHFAQRFPGKQQRLEHLVEPVSPAALDETDPDGSFASLPGHLFADSDSPLTPPPAEAQPLPDQFGRYRILKRLGQGGMGTVYLALDTRLGRQVALKVPRFAPGTNPENLQRFYREARATATINHPNLCPLYDVGEFDGVPYLTMPFIDGWPLTRFTVRENRLSQFAVAATVRKIALAVQEAHQVGVIHRDLKPSNIMINKRGEPIVMDFGLARWVQNDKEDARLTQTGAILGAPVYMSPEQVYGDVSAMGPACDVYSLGVILYELLTGNLPFDGGNTRAVLAKTLMLEAPRPSLRRPDLAPMLEAICLQAMARGITERYPSMQAFADALGEYLRQSRQDTWTLRRPGGAAPGSEASPAPIQQDQAVQASTVPPAAPETRIESAGRRRPHRAGPPVRRSRWFVGLLAVGLPLLLALPLLAIVSWYARVPGGHLVVRVVPEGSEVEIWLGDRPFPAERLREGVPLEAGEHPLVVAGEPFEEVARTVRIVPGETARVEVELRPRGRGPEQRLPIDMPYPPAPGRIHALAVAPAVGLGLSGGDDFDLLLWNLDRHAILARLTGHTLPITGVATNRDGDRGASCAGDGTVRVWDLANRRTLHVLRGHNDWPRCVALDGHGTRAVSGDDDGRLLVWDVGAGRLVRTLDGHAGPVRAVSLNASGKRALSAGDDGTLRLWNVETGKQLQILGASGEPLRSLAWSPNGKLCASGGVAGTIRLWSLETGKELHSLRGHTGQVRGLVFSADGNRLHSAATGAEDNTVRAWNVSNGALIHGLGEVSGGSNALALAPDGISLLSAGDDRLVRGWDPARKSDRPLPSPPSLAGSVVRQFDAPTAIARMALSADGGTLVLGGTDGSVGIWDATSATRKRLLPGRTRGLRALAISPNGRFVATGGSDPEIRVCDLQIDAVEILTGHTDAVTTLQFAGGGRFLASGSFDRSVIVWDLARKTPLHKLSGHQDDVTAVASTSDGKQLVSVEKGGRLNVWNVETGEARSFGATRGAGFTCLAVFPDGKRAVTGGADRTVRLWDLTPAEPAATTVTVLPKPVTALAVSPCGRWFAVAGEDNQVERWETATLRLEQRNYRAQPTGLAFTPEGRSLISAGGRVVKIWGLTRAEADPAPLAASAAVAKPTRKLVPTKPTTIETAALSPDGKTVVAVGSDKDAQVWDVATGEAKAPLAGHTARLHGVCFLPDGKRVVTCGWDHTARLWDLATGKQLLTFQGHTAPVIRLAVSGDGRYLLTGSKDRTARLWEVASGRPIRTLEGHGADVWSVALSRDGFLAVTGSHDRSVRWWDLATGKPVGGYVSPVAINAVALSADNRRIVAGGKGGLVVLLDVATGAEIARFPGHEGTVASVAFSPDGRHVASSGDDRTVRVWNVETGREVRRLAGFDERVWSVAFSSDGTRLVTGSNDPFIGLWDLPGE